MAAYTRKQYSGAARNTTTTTLLTNVGTTVDIAATTGWPSIAGIPFYVVINPSSIFEEKCLATISGSTLTLVRSQDDTTASQHPIGSVIYPVFTANDADEANELVSKLTTAGDLLTTDGTNLLRLGVGPNGYFLKASSSASAGIEWASIPTINSLDDIGDVTITTVESGDFLTYNSSASAWVNETIHFITVSDNPPNDEVAEGDLWYNSLELELYTYYSGAWVQMTDANAGVQELYELADVLIDNPVYGETLVYNGTEWENGIPVASSLATSRIIALSGDVSGSVSFDGSASVSIPTTIQLNSIVLGADTTGNFVSSLVAGTGITITNNSGEAATPTIAVGQDVSTSASVTFSNVTADLVGNVTGNADTATALETTRTIELSGDVSGSASFDGTANINLFTTVNTASVAIGELYGVNITSPEEFQTLEYDGTEWVNQYASVVSYVRNAEATTITAGTPVYLFGGNGDHASVKRADNTTDATSSKTVGLAGANIAASENGPVITRGYVDGVDLSMYVAGDVLWLGKNGQVTTTKPSAPDHLVFIGVVVRATINGIVYVATQNGYELEELHDVKISGVTDGQFLRYNSASTMWVNDTINLGTDTVGNYMSELTQGTGVTITHTPGEGSNATIAIGQSVGTSASVTFANLTITGDLTVSGTTTSINTTELTVEDNIVVLNSNVTGAPTENAGLEVERGSSANVALRWNETSDKWEITEDGSAYLEVATTTDISAAALTSISDLPDVATGYQIGSTGPAGGIIFITPDTTGNTTGLYFEAAPSASQVQRSWATGANQSLVVSGADGTAIGTGSQNTIDIVAQSGNVSATSAAAYASDYEYGGFSDWFLPSIDELQEIYANESSINGVLSNNYWSSTEYSATQAEYQNLGDGGQGFSAKSNSLYVRPVRAFNSPATGDFLKWSGSAWVNDPINLGADTTGNYMSELTQGTGVTITHTPSEGSNATIAIGQDVSTSASVTFANVSISGRIDKTTIRESVADTSVSASVVTADYSTGDIFYVDTAPSSNFTVNLTNAPADNGKAVTVVLFVTQGSTGYIPNAVQVAGSAQTIKWANGAAPIPTSSAGKIDIFSFTFVRRSSAWTVFGSSNLGY